MSKKGKRMGSRVKRYMRLDGTTLSNHHSPEDPPTWQVSIKDASVTANPRKRKLILELYNAKMELFTDTKEECEQWVIAIQQARKKIANSKTDPGSEPDKENLLRVANSGHTPHDESGEGSEKASEKAKVMDTLSKSFKVVKPVVRQVSSSSESESEEEEEDDDEDEQGPQPKNGLGRIYEETPNSMIFKQFNFKI